MIEWLSANLSSIIVLAVVVLIVAAVIVKMIRDKKQGKGGCSCGCGGCANASVCHPAAKKNH